MRTSAQEIDRFYATPKGWAAKTAIARRLRALWPDARGLDVLGLGFAGPYLEPYRASARRAVAFAPAAQGATPWPAGEGVKVACTLGDEASTPFLEALFDRVILVHALEEAEAPARLLREVWRITAPQARIVIVAAHRSGLWARAEATPFGHGRPFSKPQLARLLDGAMFESAAWSRALYAPPTGWGTGPRRAAVFEKLGEQVWPAFGGLILVEAVKRIAALPSKTAPAPARAALEGAPASALSPHANQTRRRERSPGP